MPKRRPKHGFKGLRQRALAGFKGCHERVGSVRGSQFLIFSFCHG